MSFKIRIILRRGNITTLNLDQITERGVGWIYRALSGMRERWGEQRESVECRVRRSERCKREIKLR